MNHQRFSRKNPQCAKKKKKFLIAFDNADNLLNGSDSTHFKALLEHLHVHCPRLHVVLTSALGTIDSHLMPKIIHVPHLDASESAELFMTIVKDKIKEDDVCDLILLDERFPIKDYAARTNGLDKIEPGMSSD